MVPIPLLGGTVAILDSKLTSNPYHPFTRVGDNKFVLNYHYPIFYYCLATAVISLFYLIFNRSELSLDQATSDVCLFSF
ncbi:hypothetical protein RCL1_000879 [Eukaryota sp. TZLM3-RCL]